MVAPGYLLFPFLIFHFLSLPLLISPLLFSLFLITLVSHYLLMSKCFIHVSTHCPPPKKKKERKRSASGKMPKNTISMLLAKKKNNKKKPHQALSSFFWKSRGHSPFIELSFWRVTWAVGHSVSESQIWREPNFDPGGETLGKSLSLSELHAPPLKHRCSI